MWLQVSGDPARAVAQIAGDRTQYEIDLPDMFLGWKLAKDFGFFLCLKSL